MSIEQKLMQIDELQQKINSYGKLPDSVLKKINYKFRLEWNYTSNSMEGNTLTKEETRSVMIGNITVEGKPIKDIWEMKGHDEVINNILKIGRGELNISEKRIKEIHVGIMYEEDPEKKKMIGQWKTSPNYLHNYKNERFDFTAPADVPEKMHQLINRLNAERDKIMRKSGDAMHPILLALKFNVDYVTIHPFYDGNGRTSRILTNLILISYGYPPLYIKENERRGYYQYLGDIQGYGGEPDVFYDYMAGLILRSQRLISDVIEGKDIEEQDDLDKKLKLLEIKLNDIPSDEEIKMKFSKETFLYCCNSWIYKLIEITVPVIQKFNKFFTGTKHNIFIIPGGVYVSFVDESAEIIISKLTENIDKELEKISQPYPKVTIQTFYGTFIKGGLQTFGCNYNINIQFDEIKYEVSVDDFDELTASKVEVKKYEKLLHQALTEKEINDIVQIFGNTIYKHIEYATRKNGLRK